MPPPTPCPVSEVDRALASYINSREETLKIRRTISRYLTSSLRPVTAATKSQHLNHECPQSISAAPTNPPGLKGSRLEYLHALRAHSQAQAKHHELQASLEDLHQRHVDENPTQAQADHDNGTTSGYIALLRHRRRFTELQIIQDSLEKLLTARPSHTPQDPKDLIQETIGSQPDLPAERLDQLSQPNDDQTWVFKLKQEVLDSRSNMDRATAAKKSAQAQSRTVPTLHQQVHALELARDEIIEWVQTELAKMEEDSVFLEDASPVKRPRQISAPVDLGSVEDRIRQAYDQYTTSRANLIQGYVALQQAPPSPQPNDTAELTTTTATSSYAPHPLPLSKILPHLPHLARTASSERALLQQSVYLNAQIAAADQDIEDALLRLSGESHLLPAGSKDVVAWGRTAAEAESATREFAEGRLEECKGEVGEVVRVVELWKVQGEVLGVGR